MRRAARDDGSIEKVAEEGVHEFSDGSAGVVLESVEATTGVFVDANGVRAVHAGSPSVDRDAGARRARVREVWTEGRQHLR
jgi:hypothetical protein